MASRGTWLLGGELQEKTVSVRVAGMVTVWLLAFLKQNWQLYV